MRKNYSGGVVNFPKVSKAERLTDTKTEHLLASYYGINSFDITQRYITVLETTVQEHLPTIKDVATLGLVNLKTKKFIQLAKTRAWNFQQGCMAHWLGTAPDSKIIYNDFRDRKFVSIILNVFTKKEECVISHPVSGVSPEGEKAVSINFARLRITRPDYGYDGRGCNPRLDEPYPADDGLFLIDLKTGKSKLIVSIAEVKKFLGIPSDVSAKSLMWFNHTLFNKDGTRIFFLARIQKKDRGWHTVSMTVNPDGKELRACFPSYWNWSGSHYDWYSKDKLMITALYQEKKWCPVFFTDGKNDYQILGNGLLDFDGHGTFSPDGKWMLIDRYPDSVFHMQNLMLMDMSTNAVLSLGRFYEPPRFFNPKIPEYWRCDLHPRWSPRGDMIVFNSVHEGSRQVYIIRFEFGEVK
ncbi:hypothetical protein AUJ66_01470 [Candidatus Desantisbacteria bacterium CG1_02_38_46]|uniref:Oligogalacturonate lyase domain-containing protein n=1 Tax=Candidatus Desantisbacteria bacterium CG1_02_38_46 TaxID=1817893 RepID=A0A1J4SFD2_9BACT|nr:MAG: hypothetical protein AUJ66_01470 [Candidatus Desantisbacteria bacterium CG1_02_38_46]